MEAVARKVTDQVETNQPLGKDETYEESIVFHPDWCESFFNISEDENVDLHGIDGDHRIVQGTGIMTKASAAFSRCMPGFAVISIGQLDFLKAVPIGSTVVLSITRLDSKRVGTKLTAVLKIGDELVLKTHITLAHKRAIRRIM